MKPKIRERLWGQIVCNRPLFPLVPVGAAGCVCEDGERTEQEHHSPGRRSLREPGRHCVPISPHPWDIRQGMIQKAEGNVLIIKGVFRKYWE